ncbi:putative toxin-antitoxin system toxin component, PIN family [Caenimonas sedimenti]|uniref:Putative toxin-antitoxin system toxin component, PIN family n=1 Tax=Caenimonas sedimenti TaxID=2596921 RepID=A0A562ZTX6_9BURK|nr:putative toxin-antitoxin system toxin component, PIN family [Caenimonas sedimenti]TWO71735.1 putative toxin-antitoxin system toxin component, PIN family [Caenimonas sedimenti]
MQRVVFDTSSLVGAALQVGSVPHAALHHALANAVLLASARTLDELQRVLRRPKFDAYLPMAMRREFFDIVARAAVIVEVAVDEESLLRPACRDAEDNKFLALAAAAEAQVIISSDLDLLTLDPWNGVRIMKPARYLAEYAPTP